MKQLIINADDLGRTQEINDGIENAYCNGIVSSASLVANSQAFDNAIAMSQRNPGLGVGIHLATHEYPPLLDSRFLKELANLDNMQLYFRIARATNREVNLIEQNYCLQIDKIVATGIRPTHLDGHNHLHVHPRLFGTLRRLVQYSNVRWVRMPRERPSPPGGISSKLKRWILNSACWATRMQLRGEARHPDWFHGLSYGGALSVEALEDIFSNRVQTGLNELMCHVGTDDDDPPFSIGYHWRNELEVMLKYNKEDMLSDLGIEIVSYRDVGSDFKSK